MRSIACPANVPGRVGRADEGNGLENRRAGYPAPWVRIPHPPPNQHPARSGSGHHRSLCPPPGPGLDPVPSESVLRHSRVDVVTLGGGPGRGRVRGDLRGPDRDVTSAPRCDLRAPGGAKSHRCAQLTSLGAVRGRPHAPWRGGWARDDARVAAPTSRSCTTTTTTTGSDDHDLLLHHLDMQTTCARDARRPGRRPTPPTDAPVGMDLPRAGQPPHTGRRALLVRPRRRWPVAGLVARGAAHRLDGGRRRGGRRRAGRLPRCHRDGRPCALRGVPRRSAAASRPRRGKSGGWRTRRCATSSCM